MQVKDTTVAVAHQSITSTNELTLAELADYINTLKMNPTVEQIKGKFSSLLLRQRDYESFRLFTEKRYARNLIARSDFAELLMLCWRSGQRTPIHDHGGSIGVVMVVEGLLTETMYEQAPEGCVKPYNTFRWSPGGITGAEVQDIHQLLNLQPAGRDLVTLHCYAPPLSVLNTFSPVSGRVRKWREGYFTGGGWNLTLLQFRVIILCPFVDSIYLEDYFIMLPHCKIYMGRFFQIAFSSILLLTLAIHSTPAQSGRNKTPTKPTQPPPQPAPPTQPEKEETTKSKTNSESGIKVLVVYYRSSFMNSGVLPNIVSNSCLERLKESNFVIAQSGSEMNRKEAYDFAKATKDTYVLWFQLEADIGDTENVNNRTIPSIVDFVLFTPETGKTKTSGHVYTRQRGSLPTGIPTTNYPGSYQLQRAGQELADRILDTLSLPKLPRRI